MVDDIGGEDVGVGRALQREHGVTEMPALLIIYRLIMPADVTQDFAPLVHLSLVFERIANSFKSFGSGGVGAQLALDATVAEGALRWLNFE